MCRSHVINNKQLENETRRKRFFNCQAFKSVSKEKLVNKHSTKNANLKWFFIFIMLCWLNHHAMSGRPGRSKKTVVISSFAGLWEKFLRCFHFVRLCLTTKNKKHYHKQLSSNWSVRNDKIGVILRGKSYWNSKGFFAIFFGRSFSRSLREKTWRNMKKNWGIKTCNDS